MMTGLPRFFNPLVEALNARIKLPKFVLFIYDMDFIKELDSSRDGVPQTYDKLVTWILTKAETSVRRRKTELFDKKPGAIIPGSPEFIWVKILRRPQDVVPEKLYNMRNKFNNILEAVLFQKKGYVKHYILSIEVDSDEFIHSGFLSNDGKNKFRREVNSYIEKFERREINLKPKGNSKKSDKSKNNNRATSHY